VRYAECGIVRSALSGALSTDEAMHPLTQRCLATYAT
jgi:hypothetical protein